MNGPTKILCGDWLIVDGSCIDDKFNSSVSIEVKLPKLDIEEDCRVFVSNGIIEDDVTCDFAEFT